MLDKPLIQSSLEEVVLPSAQSLTHTLPHEKRLIADIPPIQRLEQLNEDTYEEIICIWAYVCLSRQNNYKHVYRVGGTGDKGRDVIAIYETPDQFDLFQCKHYDHPLNYSDLSGEIGKLITYTYNNTYNVPKHYYLVCPKGVAQSFLDLLLNSAKELKASLIRDWDASIKCRVGRRNGISLDDRLKNYINTFDFNIIEQIEPMKFIEEFRKNGQAYFFWYFGGGLNSIIKPSLEVPENPSETENNYTTNLYDAYSEHANRKIDASNISQNHLYNNHFNRERIKFYAAEEIRVASRQSTPHDCDEFEQIEARIENFIGDTLDDYYSDGFSKVKTVINKANEYDHPTGMLISHYIDSSVKQGICHHLSNENRITWKTKE